VETDCNGMMIRFSTRRVIIPMQMQEINNQPDPKYLNNVGVRTHGVLNQRVNAACLFPGW
jgi:hypothetical protein